jgi:hypothetical protein
MPNRGNEVEAVTGEGPGEFGLAWKGFAAALRRLLTEPPSDRPLDAFLTLRNATLDAFEDAGMIADLQSAWHRLHTKQDSPNPAHLLLMDLLAFPAALELKAAEEKVTKRPVILCGSD